MILFQIGQPTFLWKVILASSLDPSRFLEPSHSDESLASRYLRLALLMLFIPATFATQSASAQTAGSEPKEIQRVQDVVEHWTPSQHLYVKGDVGVSKQQLQKLEAWLDENGKHWTIVLMQNADQESFKTATNFRYFGMDAVEHALGHQLSNQTDFGVQLHPQTHEPDGAIFVLFRQEKKFNYFASDAQDRRYLGESKWRGTLDREAIRAMRHGERVADAVKNTVSLINGALERKIAQEIRRAAIAVENEARQKEREKAQRAEQIERLKTNTLEAKASLVSRAVARAAELKSEFPEASESKLANPPSQSWNAELDAIIKYLANPKLVDDAELLSRSGMFQTQKMKLRSIHDAINRHLDALAAHDSFDDILSPVIRRLDVLAAHPSGVTKSQGEEGYGLLDQARLGHEQGELNFVEKIEAANELAMVGERLLKAERERQRQEDARHALVRKTIVWSAGGLAVLLMGLLTILNYRRRPFLNLAHETFERRNAEVHLANQNIESTLTRCQEILGTRSSFAGKSYEGQTLLRGQDAFNTAQHLQSMASETKRLLADAQILLSPANVLGQAANMFSSRRYQQCITLLESNSLQLPKTGIADAPEIENEVTSVSQDAIRDLSWVNFEQFFAGVDQNRNKLGSELDAFEVSFQQIDTLVSRLQDRIDGLIESEQALSRQARRDRYLKTPSFFEVFLPSLQNDSDRAMKTAETDPLTVTTEVLPTALRKTDNGLSIVSTLQKARAKVFPMLDEASDKLKTLRYDIEWIESNVLQLAAPADQLFVDSIKQDVSLAASRFEQRVLLLGVRGKRTSELATEINQDVEPELNRLKERVARERNRIASKLQITEDAALHETNYDPDVRLVHADDQLVSAKAAIQYGGVESAVESLEVLTLEARQAEQLTDATLAALHDYDTDRADRDANLRRLNLLLPERISFVEDRRERFAESALFLRPEYAEAYSIIQAGMNVPESDGATPPTMGVALSFSQQSLTQTGASLESSTEDHFQGKVLQAANMLALMKDELEDVDELLMAVQQHCVQMDEQTAANVEVLKAANERVGRLGESARDHRVQRPTLAMLERVQASFTRFENAFYDASAKRDPFRDQDLLGGLLQEFDFIVGAINADFNVHQEASRSVEAAKLELQSAIRLSDRVAQDRIPDSREIDMCRSAVASASQKIDYLGHQLSVHHENWKDVDGAASDVVTRLAVTIGELQRQLELARRAAGRLSEASEAVFEAANWRGSHGVVVVGDPGTSDLSDARRALSRGEYVQCINLSQNATQDARRAISVAEGQVRKERRRIQREAEDRRRRRQRRSSASGHSWSSSSSSSSGSMFGSSFGGSSSSSSSSSSFGSSSSSSSSSGSSGFGQRSGW